MLYSNDRLKRFAGLSLLLLSVVTLAPVLVAAETSDSTILSFSRTAGFCPNGVFSTTNWPQGERPEGLAAWGSFCGAGDAETGHAESEQFLAPQPLVVYLAGYPGQPNLRFALKNVRSGQEFELRPPSPPGESWRRYTFAVPADWVGKAVQIEADDQATSFGGWFGFTQPILQRYQFCDR